MKDFLFRNDTRLLFRNDIRPTIKEITHGQKVMLVYGGGSIKGNGCYADLTEALAEADVPCDTELTADEVFETIERLTRK